MLKTITTINIIKLSVAISAGVFISCYLPSSVYAKEISTANIVELINISRLEKNIPPLQTNPTLSKVAQSKASDMLKNNYFAHTSPAGMTPWHWFDTNNYSYKYAGENLAINYDDAEEEHEAWMLSPTHKKNILNPNFNEIGVTTTSGLIDGKKSNITVTVFGTPAENIFATSARLSVSDNYNSAIKAPSKEITTSSLDNTPQAITQNIFFQSIKEQSRNILWTISLIVILIVLRDMILKTIQTKNFHHRPAIINLILFVMIYSVLF